MKRRDGSFRRPVLDVDNPPPSWKNKYQAIAERSVNGTVVKGESTSNPLARLVGGYASESDDDDDNPNKKNSLDVEIEEFMKEVESPKGNDEASNMTCAWQECYDESTGYPYYWNMNTNEVTWEPPPELVAYQAVLAAKVAQTQAKVKAQAQQAQWAVEQAALGLTPDFPVSHKRIPTATKKQKKSSSTTMPLPANQRGRGSIRKPSSESDDEKIEMITSWADEESEDDDEQIKRDHQTVSEKKQINDGNFKPKKVSQNVPSNAHKAPKLPKPAPPPPVIFGPQLPSSSESNRSHFSKTKNRSRSGSTEESVEIESKVVIQKLRRLKTESDVIIGSRERVPVRKALDRSGSRSPNDRLHIGHNRGKSGDSGCDGEAITEKSLARRLQQEVQTLKDLGGIVPSDIRNLLNSCSKSSQSSSMTAADNIIAMIEMEQPPDHKQDEKLLSSLNSAVHTVQKCVQRIQTEKLANGNDDKTVNGTAKPTSFALIAGYGDDSDQEDVLDSGIPSSGKDSSEPQETPVAERSLFPILSHEDSIKDDISTKPVEKLNLGCDSSTATKIGSDGNIKPSLILDHGPVQKRKKRLDIGSIHPQPPPNISVGGSEVSEESSNTPLGVVKSTQEEATVGPSSYTTVWSNKSTTYASDPTANDRRGFGFQVPGAEEPPQVNAKSKKGKIQFIKAETINVQSAEEDSVNVRESDKDIESKNVAAKPEDKEAHRSLSSLAQLVKAKLQFLCEGKEPVSPVQAMAIQIETLVTAWNAGALNHSFLQRWLQSTGSELVELECAAAPQGWAVQWDRTYKRYFYCNLATKDTQWDYPVASEDGSDEAEEKKDSTKAEPRAVTPPPDDEDAMELCTTPPPEEEGTDETGPPSRPPSPQLIPPPFKRQKIEHEGESTTSAETPECPPCPPCQPPLPSTPPPLPSSPPPPPPDTPPPPPGTPPAPPHVTEHGEPLPPGVDTPEAPFIPVRPAMPPPSLAMPADIGPHIALNPLQPMGPLHPGSVMGVPVMSAMAMQYSGNGSYVPPPPTEAMLASYNHATAVDYMGYMGVYAGPTGPMQVTSVAAPPLAYTGPAPQASSQPTTAAPQRKKESLMSELSSFYSDIASLDSNSRDAIEDDTSQDATANDQPHFKSATPPVPLVPAVTQSSEDSNKAQQSSESSGSQLHLRSHITSSETVPETASTKKKKKTKLAPGLTLKKKGVSNLVAKWQQVQQEVWKDYQEDEEDE